MSRDVERLGDLLKRKREEFGFACLSKATKKLKISNKDLYAYEKNTLLPDEETAEKLFELYEIDEDDLEEIARNVCDYIDTLKRVAI